MKSLYDVKCLMFNVFVIYFLFFTAYNIFAQPATSVELINNAKRYNGNTVVYTGEVIGEVMKRGKYVWLNVNDGANAVGIWLGKDLVKDIRLAGNYKTKGDVVEVKGVFSRSCIEHGGDFDIHAVSLRKVNEGIIVPEKINMVKKNLVLILTGGLCLVWILKRLKRK